MQFKEIIFPPGATPRDWAFDGVMAGTLMVGQLASNLLLGDRYFPQTTWEHVVCLGMLASLVFRRHSPLLAFGLVAVFGVAHLSTLNNPTFSAVAVPIVVYAVARWIPGHLARTVLVVGAMASVAGPYTWFWSATSYLANSENRDVLTVTFAGLCFGGIVTSYILGRRAAEGEDARERELAVARDRDARAAIEREQQARLNEASTRAQIARELHDVVAHSLSIMIVQAEGGRALARKSPEAADQALHTIAEVGRDSLTEMRRIVGILRGAPQPAAFAPAPSLADIPELVQRTGGERFTLAVEGEPAGTTAALELTLYRVVQEALTNVLKHAGPDAHAHVALRYGPRRITAEITDDGIGVPLGLAGGGNGLQGMRERVASMAGTVECGPRPDAPGFRVWVSLPVRPSHLTEPPTRPVLE